MSSSISSFRSSRPEETEALARQFVSIAKAGDVFLLEGDIGAGKSVFARAFVREAVGSSIDVPSPTFTLVQTYDANIGEIWHCDLYRLTSPDDVFELGLDLAFTTSISLIEWPDRLGEETPSTALHVSFQDEDDTRSIRFSGDQSWAERVASLDV